MALEQLPNKNIETASFSLGQGWNARAITSRAHGFDFSPQLWQNALNCPDTLFDNVQSIIKAENANCVAMKTLTIEGKTLNVIMKKHAPEKSIRGFFRSFKTARALANFNTALKLVACDIPVAAPLAALQKRKFSRCVQSIYITEFFDFGISLHHFLAEKLPKKPARCLSLKKHLSLQVAQILGDLHKNNLWHRDSKATNFMVYKNTGSYGIALIDMDGIKPYRLRRKSSQLRTLWTLAASLMTISAVTAADCLRTFKTYCNLIGLDISQQRSLFCELARKALKKHKKRLRDPRRSVYAKNKLKNILIIKPSSLGDIVMALPALASLRKNFPDALISWFVRPEFRQLLDGHPYLDEIIFFDRKFLGKALYNLKAMTALLGLIKKLRRKKFDAVIDLQGLFRTAAFAWLSGCPKRFGPKNAREFARLFYTNKAALDNDSIHVVDHYLNIIKQTGAADITPEFLLPENPRSEQQAIQLLKGLGVNLDNYAVLVPGSAHLDKCWPAERFAELAEGISKKFGFSVVATGSASESQVVENIRSLAHVPITNLAGKTDLAGLIAVMKNAKLVVSNDTGPGHIASVFKMPIVIIFGRSNPNRVYPYGRPHCVAAADIQGRGFEPDSLLQNHHINNVSCDMVLENITLQLRKKTLEKQS